MNNANNEFIVIGFGKIDGLKWNYFPSFKEIYSTLRFESILDDVI